MYIYMDHAPFNVFLKDVSNMLLKKSKGKSKNFYKKMTMKTWQLKTYGMQQKQF